LKPKCEGTPEDFAFHSILSRYNKEAATNREPRSSIVAGRGQEEGEDELMSPEEAAAVRCDARLALLRVSSAGLTPG